MTEPSQVLKHEDDYQITADILYSESDLPSPIVLKLLSFGSVVLTIAMIYSVTYQRYAEFGFPSIIVSAVLGGIVIFLIASMGGNSWHKAGIKLSSMTFKAYTSNRSTRIERIYARIYQIFGDKDQLIYLEAMAKDPKFRGFKHRFALIFRISISQLSFFIVASTFIARPGIAYIRSLFPDFGYINKFNFLFEIQILIALFISVILTGFYLPATFIIRDSNIRTWDPQERRIGTPLASLQNKADSFVGFGAILAGWEFYKGLQVGNRLILIGVLRIEAGDLFWEMIDYVLLLVYILILSWPLILPAAITYFKKHGNLVNEFRYNAMNEGVQVAVTKIRIPEGTEIEIVKNSKFHDHNE